MTNVFSDLANANSPMVQEALTRSCMVCKSGPGEACTQMPINGFPLETRLVHYARTVD